MAIEQVQGHVTKRSKFA